MRSRLQNTFSLVVATAMGAACADTPPRRGQVVVVVDTDAIAPLVRGAQPDPTRLPAQIDRARFDVLADGRPLAGSTREFAVDQQMFRAQKVSFGVLPAPGDVAVAVRVRLFLADHTRPGDPPAGVTLDTVATLPPVAVDGVTTVSVVLRADDFGRTIGPIAATPSSPASSREGTWRGGRRIGCSAVPDAGESCVPGGAFFFGDPAFRGRNATNDITDERLVWLSPFLLDRTEVTVEAFRARWPALASAGLVVPLARDASGNIQQEASACTWTEAPELLPDGTSRDRLPLNCVSWETARAYCRALGGDLPTEAQFEYASSGLGEEQAYPWGNDEPDCTMAIWGRGGEGAFSEGSSACRRPETPGGPAFPGSGTRDRLDTAPFVGGEIVDLGGNLSEWALDMWNRASDPLWSTVTPMFDPVATLLGVDGDRRPARSGNWAVSALPTRAGFRIQRAPDARLAIIGFRCARPAGAAP